MGSVEAIRRSKEAVLGIGITGSAREAIVEAIVPAACGRPAAITIACANAHSLVTARQDLRFAGALKRSDVVVPDGVSVVIASRLRGGTIRAKCGGPDLFEAISRAVNTVGGARYYFVGSTAETLRRIATRLGERYPGIALAGVYAPPFRELTERESLEIVDEINATAPTVVWVGLTAPKQELWVDRYRSRLTAPVVGCIGAAFDYFAGTKRRPAWLARHGLAWAYRLASEPRRLWRRYLISCPVFFYWVWRDTVGR